jgi:hypothetical protein
MTYGQPLMNRRDYGDDQEREESPSKVVLAYVGSKVASGGVVTSPLPKELPETKIIYRDPEPGTAQEMILGRFGESVSTPTTEPEEIEGEAKNQPVKLAPSGDERSKDTGYRRTPDQKPPRRKTNPKSYTHDKNREYQQKFKDLNGERK